MPIIFTLIKQKWTLRLTLLVLGAFVFASALMVVYTKHVCRQLFNQLQMQEKEIESFQIEWSQLLLEQGTWTADARVERVAKQRLQLVLPEPKDVVVINNSAG